MNDDEMNVVGRATTRATMKARRRMKAIRKTIDSEKEDDNVKYDGNEDYKEEGGKGGRYLSVLESQPRNLLRPGGGTELSCAFIYWFHFDSTCPYLVCTLRSLRWGSCGVCYTLTTSECLTNPWYSCQDDDGYCDDK